MNLEPSYDLTSLEKSLGRLNCKHDTGASSSFKLIAITGGPGAGKTAVLNVAQNLFCKHFIFIPEAATIIFSGGFWRAITPSGLKATQMAIFHVQRQLESFASSESSAAYGLCDRGTIDCDAYWSRGSETMWDALGVDRASELARYTAVIHLRTPSPDKGYNHSNKVRLESAERAAEIDADILSAWDGHPNRTVIDSTLNFQDKIDLVLTAIRSNTVL